MALIADILLVAAALSAGLYCLILSRRLNRFTDLEKGVGGAVAVLSAQVDDMTRALEKARLSAGASADGLEALTARAEGVAKRLEILMAAMHDVDADPPAEPGRAKRVVWRRPHGPAEGAPAGAASFRRAAGQGASE